VNSRLKDKNFIMYLVVSILLFAIFIKLFTLQIAKGNDYLKQSQAKLTNSVEVSAPRGIIYDRNGRPLITNRVGFSVQVVYSSDSGDKINDILLSVVNVLSKNGDEYVDSLPISAKKYKFTYKDSETITKEDKIKAFKEKYEIPLSADGKKALKYLAKRYKLDDRYTYEEIRKIVGMRYELEVRGLAFGAPVTIANDVSMDTVSVLKENSSYYSNINVITSPFRNYVHGSLASHILGRVGVIYQEEYELLKDQNYGMNDIIGKDGLEKFLEPYIKGTDGKINKSRNITSDTYAPDEIAAIPGNDAVLTIDYELQKIAEESLKETIEDIRKKGQISDDKAGADAGGGAVVVTDVRTGEILAIASYPDFDPARFDKDYEKLIEDSGKPMFNRAISGTYPPGSVFKIVTAIAGLEEGEVTTKDVIVDKGQYEHYGQTFNCWIWTQSGKTHESQNVEQAIGNSCNYYFYEIGKRLGEKKIYEYAEKFGLGKKTGIEIEGESAGILANEKYKKDTFDQVWYPGDTLQMAIGQSFNVFTPLQLVSYISAVANGGTCYRPHLTRLIRSSADGSVVKEFGSEVTGKVNMSKETYRAVTHGMYLGSREGTSSAVFSDFPINVCSKTGSAQVNTGSANGVFASYAPYENPQIAVAVVIENAGSGAALAPIARKIYERYFDIGTSYSKDKISKKNILSQ
jgi:penicillin-binding protein 2